MKQGMRLRVAAVQLSSNENKKRNIACAIKLVKEAIASDAKFIGLPETFNYRGKGGKLSPISEEIPGVSLLPLMQLAKQHKVWILAGSIYEKVKNSTRPYNTSVLIDNRGKLKAKYRKIHLFDAAINGRSVSESKLCLAGRRAVVALIDGVKAGLSICYDLRFPELYRGYAHKGAELICIPSSFTAPTGEAHWEILLRARAIENQCFVIAPNCSGIGLGSVMTYGNSMIVDPWGRVLARAAKTGEGVIYADLDFAQLVRVHKTLPLKL
jgi:predicted amidohydrolase